MSGMLSILVAVLPHTSFSKQIECNYISCSGGASYGRYGVWALPRALPLGLRKPKSTQKISRGHSQGLP